MQPVRKPEEIAKDGAIHTAIAGKVREDSQKLVKLTPVASLTSIVPEAKPEEITRYLSGLEQDEKFKDIKLITNSRGVGYLYSETYVSNSYARILARAEAKDAALTIVDTVREDSRIYPRASKIEVFKEPVFGIEPDKLDEYVSLILKTPEFKDIRLVRASNGAGYLYSTLYIQSEDWVKSVIEWWEVGQFQNP